MRATALLACLALAACAARPLTPSETAFLGTIQGETVNLARVRVVKGAAAGLVEATVPPRPRTTCVDRLYPPATGTVLARFPAFTIGYTTYFARHFYPEDALAGYPGALPLADAMRLAHEATHVWQWQNRAETGYHPFRALAEHRASADPYLFEEGDGRRFLDYGWEQQGAIVEEFVCCRALDPHGARTGRLARLLGPHFPGLERQGRVPRSGIRLPWSGAETTGLCS